jgi:hypothetical protein
MEIVVYKAEQEAGLESQIRANASVAWQSDVQLCEAFDLGGAKASLLPEHAVAENKNQIDLHYLRTVMVSSAWNLNDDVFTPEEMWLARATPEDKPFNYMHEQSDIIGHITNAVAVDESMRPIPEDTPSDKLPEHYHIVTNAVLYKFWEKPELQERMNRLIAEIADNRWFVSMEALFYGFDYALKTAKGWQIIERNDKTAFLTKHLRVYGGKGEFEGKKLGRVLRRIVFSGKGLVSKPANPESVILEASKASGYELPREETHTMSAEIETVQAEAIEAKAKAEKLEAELAAANEKLAQVEAEKRLARLTASVAEKLEADAVHALAIATALSGLTDEAFEAAVASANEYMAAKLAAYKGQADKAKAAEDLTATVEALKAQVEELKKIAAEITPAPKGLGEANPPKPAPVMSIPMDKGSVPPEAAPVVATVLENVIPSEEPALAGTVANQSVNKVAAQIAAFFGADDAETKIEAE